MKRWKLYLAIGMFWTAIGIVLLYWASHCEGFCQAKLYGRYIHNKPIDWFFMTPLLWGIFWLGIGIGLLSSVYIIYKLEK